MSRVYFISDPHLGHKSVHKFRTMIASEPENSEAVVKGVLDTCGKRDILYILGDVCFSVEAYYKYLVPIINQVLEVRIVMGNHENKEVIKLLEKEPTVRLLGFEKYKKVWLSHCPIHPAELRGKFNVHGHVHSSTLEDPRYFNVCPENIGYTPINYQVLLGELREANAPVE